MKQLSYSLDVPCSKEQLWHIVLDRETYLQWVKAFSANSDMKGEFGPGNEIIFFDPEYGGSGAVVDEYELYTKVRVRHTCLVSKNLEPDYDSDMAKKWIDSLEGYIFESIDTGSKLTVEISTHSQFVDMFDAAWPVAFATIERLVAEKT